MIEIPSCITQATEAGLPEFRRKGPFRYQCPVCNDPGNLSLYPVSKDQFYCFNCGIKGGRKAFYYALQGPAIYEQYKAGELSEKPAYKPRKAFRQVDKLELLPVETLPENDLIELWQIVSNPAIYTPENTSGFVHYWEGRGIMAGEAFKYCRPVTQALKDSNLIKTALKLLSISKPNFFEKSGLQANFFTAGKGFLIPVFDLNRPFPVTYRYRPYVIDTSKEFAANGKGRPDMLYYLPDNIPEIAIKTEGLPDFLTLQLFFPDCFIMASFGSNYSTYNKAGKKYKSEYKQEGAFRLPRCLDVAAIKEWYHLGHYKSGVTDSVTAQILQNTIPVKVTELLAPEKMDWNDKLKTYGEDALRAFFQESLK